MAKGRRFIVLFTALIMVVALAACSGSSGESGSTPEMDGSADPGGAGVPPKAAEGEIDLRILTIPNFTQTESLKPYLDDFYEIYPEIGIAWVSTPFEEYSQKLLTVAASKADEFDVVYIDAASTGAQAAAGVFDPIDPYVAGSETVDWDMFIPSVVEYFCVYDGIRYAVPSHTDCRIMFYLDEALEAAGYTQPPQTTDEYVDFCEKAAGAGYNALGLQFNLFWTPMYEWGILYMSDGGTFVTQDESGKWVANLDNPEARTWIERCRRIAKTVSGDYLITMDSNMQYAALSDKSTASTIIGPWFYPNTDPSVHDNYIPALTPMGTEKPASTMGGWMLSIYAHSSNKEAAWQFIEWVSEPQLTAAISEALPGATEAYQYPPFSEDPVYEIFAQQLETSQPVATPPFPLASQVADSLVEPFQKVLLDNSISLDDAVILCNNAIQECIDNNMDQ